MPDRRSISRRDALRITAGVGLGVAFGAGVGAELFRRAGLRRIRETRMQMGTVVALTVVHPDGAAARAMVTSAFEEMERLESILSRYRRESAVGRLNRAGRLDGPPRALVEVLTLADQVSRRSAGAFDVTIGPLIDLHVDAFRTSGMPPAEREIDRVLARVDYRGLDVDGERVELAEPGMGVSLDGIAKGFIVDRTVGHLVAGGAERVLVDAGGDMASGGAGIGVDPWTVGVQHPRSGEDLVGRVRLDGASIATSGDYLRHFTPDRRHHDILDPRTGRSPDRVSSATVVASSAARADALSTAALVLGPEDGVLLIDRLDDADCLLVAKDGTRVTSRGMIGRLG